jgi:hypothetical protein
MCLSGGAFSPNRPFQILYTDIRVKGGCQTSWKALDPLGGQDFPIQGLDEETRMTIKTGCVGISDTSPGMSRRMPG